MARKYLTTPLLALCLIATQAHAQTAQMEWVSFPSGQENLRGALFIPPGAGPHPAIIALHGCGGLALKGARMRDWSGRLTKAGFAVLFPDSFGSRGLKSQCNVRKRTVRATRERVADVHAALAWLQTRKDIKTSAISLIGWSNGGATLVTALKPERKPASLKGDFAAAIAFYPGCRFELRRGGWRSRVPLLILAGGADDWTPAQPCIDLTKDMARARPPVEIIVYPGAYHNFDHPGQPVRLRRGAAFSADGGGAVHQGTDPAARKAAIARTMMFLPR